MGVRVCTKFDEGIRDADVITCCGFRASAMRGALLPSAAEYFAITG